MTKKTDSTVESTGSSWTSKAAMAGAAIGSAAIAAAVLYASRRKERNANGSGAANPQLPNGPLESD